MFLVRIDIPLSARKTAGCLQNAQLMHKLVTDCFKSSQKEKHIVYRKRVQNNRLFIYAYADSEVQIENLPESWEVKERNVMHWLKSFSKGQIVGFDLCTSPFRKVKMEGKKNSVRKILRTKEERMLWLQRKAEANGFEILSVEEEPYEKTYARHCKDKGAEMYMDSYRYSGVLQIIDDGKFRAAVRNGIGPGKAYGLGMLLIR